MFRLDPLPPEDSDPKNWSCPQMVNLETWPYVKRCNLAVKGLVPPDMMEMFKLDCAAVCALHHKALDDDLPKEAPQC